VSTPGVDPDDSVTRLRKCATCGEVHGYVAYENGDLIIECKCRRGGGHADAPGVAEHYSRLVDEHLAQDTSDEAVEEQLRKVRARIGENVAARRAYMKWLRERMRSA
jgi:hypothetical protein